MMHDAAKDSPIRHAGREEWETKTMHSRGKLCVLLVFAAICVCALGRAEAADKVTFVTDFGYNGRHAYYFVALEKGYYARQNLDVQIVRGQGSADAVKQVAAGTAQIGFADTAAVILGRANDQIPTKLVAIVYAKPPHAIYVLKESGIAKPKDLEGKKLADTAFSAVPKLFQAYAKAANIDANKVTWLVAAADTLPGMLTTGRADGIGQFTVGEPLLAKSAAPKQILALLRGRRPRSLQQRHHCQRQHYQIEPGPRAALCHRDNARTQGRHCQPAGGRRNHEQASPRS
jgi:ABC-type nitrate/sulfonate/bicarbonate transport system substrate-binding protein